MHEQNDMEKLSGMIDEKIAQNMQMHKDEIAVLINSRFQSWEEQNREKMEQNEIRWQNIEKEIALMRAEIACRPKKADLDQRYENRLEDLGIDVEKLKFISRKDLKKIPSRREIRECLRESGLV